MEIRKARPEDAEALLEYCRAVGGESDNLNFGPEGLPLSVEAERAYLAKTLESSRDLYLICVEEGAILGVANFTAYGRERLAHRGEFSISVRRAYWGRHIATRLLERIIEFAKGIPGMEVISLEVRSDNARAIALYRKFGFEKVGEFPGFFKVRGEDVSCDWMRLALTK